MNGQNKLYVKIFFLSKKEHRHRRGRGIENGQNVTEGRRSKKPEKADAVCEKLLSRLLLFILFDPTVSREENEMT